MWGGGGGGFVYRQTDWRADRRKGCIFLFLAGIVSQIKHKEKSLNFVCGDLIRIPFLWKNKLVFHTLKIFLYPHPHLHRFRTHINRSPMSRCHFSYNTRVNLSDILNSIICRTTADIGKRKIEKYSRVDW